MKYLTLHALLVSLFVTTLTFAADPQVIKIERRNAPSFVGYVGDEIVVKFTAAVVASFQETALAQGATGIFALDNLGQRYGSMHIRQQFVGAKKKYYNGREIDLSGWYKIKFAEQIDPVAVADEYKNIAGVIDAQPIGIHTVDAIPNDTNFSRQWHLNQANDADMDAPEAWDIETGDSNVIVAILDTGVRYFHKDLGGANASYSDPTNVDGNMWVNWTEKNGAAGVDDDGNGFVDDWIGWDFVDGITTCYTGEDCNVPDNDPRDFNGHGTHCAGNVGAINNNAYATAAASGGWGDGTLQPTANGVKVMACRIGYSAGVGQFELGFVSMDFAAQAFYYAANNGAKIASCSWGSSESGGIGDAIDYFLANGGIIFKSAGNDGTESSDYMSARSDIVTVAATDSNDCKADFSNYGTHVDISAPGTNIWSLYHVHSDPENDYIASVSGTSMSTPIAASVAALIWSRNLTWTASQVVQQLYDSADDIDALACNSSYAGKLGAGRVNAFNAVNTGVAAPVADFSASPTSGCTPLTVVFTDLSTGSITSWSWDFGDGGTSTLQNPSHEYTSVGTYTVSLTVTGPGGADTETKVDYITTSGSPTAAFTADPTSGNCPLTVTFTDQSTGNPTSWQWNFPGGDPATAIGQGPHQVVYNNGGDFDVTLQVSNSCGADTLTQAAYIHVDCGILGDVNDDGVANSTDALIILSCDVGIDVSQFCPMNCGDVNSDGLVNSTDALIILSYDVGMSVPYPVGQPGCPANVSPCPGCNP